LFTLTRTHVDEAKRVKQCGCCCTSLLYLLSGAQWWRGSPELLAALQRELAQLTEDASMQVVQGATHDR
jgi:hypothetical protein